MHVAASRAIIWRVSLERIEQVVSGHLGPGRIRGNAPGPCFSRQVSMYLAKHVGHWSLSPIGKFYNGRHHTTVLHAIAKIEDLRKIDESVDTLIEVLTDELATGPHETESRLPVQTRAALVEAVAARVMRRLTELYIIETPPGDLLERMHAEVIEAMQRRKPLNVDRTHDKDDPSTRGARQVGGDDPRSITA